MTIEFGPKFQALSKWTGHLRDLETVEKEKKQVIDNYPFVGDEQKKRLKSKVGTLFESIQLGLFKLMEDSYDEKSRQQAEHFLANSSHQVDYKISKLLQQEEIEMLKEADRNLKGEELLKKVASLQRAKLTFMTASLSPEASSYLKAYLEAKTQASKEVSTK